MRIRTVAAVTALVMIAAVGCGKHKKSQFQAGAPPAFPGSYAQSCRNIVSLDEGFISAECGNPVKGRFELSYIQAAACHGDIGNQNGLLVCNGATATTTPPPIGVSDALASDAPTAAPLKP